MEPLLYAVNMIRVVESGRGSVLYDGPEGQTTMTKRKTQQH